MVAIAEGNGNEGGKSSDSVSDKDLIELKIEVELLKRKLEAFYQRYHGFLLRASKEEKLSSEEIMNLRSSLGGDFGPEGNDGELISLINTLKNNLNDFDFFNDKNLRGEFSLSSLYNQIWYKVVDLEIYFFSLSGMNVPRVNDISPEVTNTQTAIRGFQELKLAFNRFESVFMVELEKKREVIRGPRESFIKVLFKPVLRLIPGGKKD